MLPGMFSWFEARREWGVVFVRVAFGCWLIYGTQDNVFSHERMVEFQQFIARNGFPYATAGAYVSAYAQFICGILYVVGAVTRPAAAVMAINFLFALGIAHRQTPLGADWPPIGMLAVALFLLFHGPGAVSVDAWLAGRSRMRLRTSQPVP
jgi:putative oxidoreductase